MKTNSKVAVCKICKEKDNLVVYKGTHICKECIAYIKELI
ncbi:hypothetical protein F3D3_3425 [Fusibacter sp. 3D3]|nr:hypothetical protein F3D3_3425 [Fusibacter sp. 3D3]